MPRDEIWTISTKHYNMIPDSELILEVARNAPEINFRDKELSAILTEIEVSNQLRPFIDECYLVVPIKNPNLSVALPISLLRGIVYVIVSSLPIMQTRKIQLGWKELMGLFKASRKAKLASVLSRSQS